MTIKGEENLFTVITGGGSGLGLALAKETIKRNPGVIIMGRDEGKLIKAAEEVSALRAGSKVIPYPCDITRQDEIDDFILFLRENNYNIDYLFNNAGTGAFGDASGNRSPRVEEIIGSNLTGMILLTSAILENSAEEEALTIVNIMSTSALIGRASESVYCAAKWGARGFTESLRAEMKGKNRRVVAVYPGGMNTPFWDAAKGKDVSGFMEPADVAEQIATAVFSTARIMITDITINRP